MHYMYIVIIMITLVFFSTLFLQQYDCNSRAVYWNDKGFFIDTWDYRFQWCEYPPIADIGDSS